jgi:uncharacterized coiled-coil DUF342 family protein
MEVPTQCHANWRLLRMLEDAREHYKRLKNDSDVVSNELREAEMVIKQLKAKQQEHVATCPVCRPVM